MAFEMFFALDRMFLLMYCNYYNMCLYNLFFEIVEEDHTLCSITVHSLAWFFLVLFFKCWP